MSTEPVVPDQAEEPIEELDRTLSDEARAALVTLFQDIMREDQTSRRGEVRKAWQQRSFKQGIQYLWYNETSYCYQMPQASGQDLPRFMDVYNIYTPHWRSLVSLMSQSPTGVNFPPDDLQKSSDVAASKAAEKMRHKVDQTCNMRDLQQEVAGDFCTDGRVITWTRINDKGQLEVSEHGVLETKVPLYVGKMENWGYAVVSGEFDLWQTKEEYPDFADDINSEADGSAEANYEKYARLGILANRRGGQVDSLRQVATIHNAWIRPGRYRRIGKEKDASPEREEIAAKYPNGIRITVCSNKVVDYADEQMENALKVQWPLPQKGSNRPSLLHDLVPIQMAFNDCMNMLREHIDFSIPARWVTDSVDSEALAEQRSAPGVIHTLSIPAGASIQDLVMQEDVAQLPTELVSNIDRLLTLAQFTTGDFPSLYGEATAEQETFSAQKMLSDQAKGQQTLAWHGLQWLFADTYSLAIRYAAYLYSDQDTIAIPGGNGQMQVSPQAVLNGSWGAYPDPDSSFPETMADQRASLQAVFSQLGTDPRGADLVFHPNNLRLIKQQSGLKDFTIPQGEAWDKQLREIEQLLNEVPVPDVDKLPEWEVAAENAEAAGQPIPEVPVTASKKPKPRDFHQWELDCCAYWLSSNACYEQERAGNLKGIQNVELHADLHEEAIAKIAEANAPKPEPMKISAAFKDLDPATKVQALQRDGYKPDHTAYETQDVLDQQNVAATTQDKAASAHHKSVLAAREAVSPIEPAHDQIDEVKDE